VRRRRSSRARAATVWSADEHGDGSRMGIRTGASGPRKTFCKAICGASNLGPSDVPAPGLKRSSGISAVLTAPRARTGGHTARPRRTLTSSRFGSDPTRRMASQSTSPCCNPGKTCLNRVAPAPRDVPRTHWRHRPSRPPRQDDGPSTCARPEHPSAPPDSGPRCAIHPRRPPARQPRPEPHGGPDNAWSALAPA
jgi:hypothetical protein